MWDEITYPSKVWDEITYPFQPSTVVPFEVWEWLSDFITHYHDCNGCNYSSMLGFKLNHACT